MNAKDKAKQRIFDLLKQSGMLKSGEIRFRLDMDPILFNRAMPELIADGMVVKAPKCCYRIADNWVSASAYWVRPKRIGRPRSEVRKPGLHIDRIEALEKRLASDVVRHEALIDQLNVIIAGLGVDSNQA